MNLKKIKLICLLYLIFFYTLSSCKKIDYEPLELDYLYKHKDRNNNYLVRRSNGFHKLNGVTIKDSSYGIITVHGYYPEREKAKGHEWVKPLNIISEKNIPIWFFKYDWNNCIQQSTNYLHEQLEPFIDEHNYLDSIWIIGHSMGGVITALLSEQWDLKIPITVHSVAASLGEYNQKVSGCNKFKKDQYTIDEKVNFTQWKTKKEHDEIFGRMDFDPQIIILKGGKSVLLPSEWNGKRIGHNFSLYWVCKNI
mgnify:CR=1 FL=1